MRLAAGRFCPFSCVSDVREVDCRGVCRQRGARGGGDGGGGARPPAGGRHPHPNPRHGLQPAGHPTLPRRTPQVGHTDLVTGGLAASRRFEFIVLTEVF